MNESPLYVRTYDFLMWLIPQVIKFPRVHRFGLGERIQHLALDFQDSLIAAGKSNGDERHQKLQQADIQLEQIRFWMRFSCDNHLARLRLRLTRRAMMSVQPNAELSSYPTPNKRPVLFLLPSLGTRHSTPFAV
jgi:hypothetical protein